LSRWHLTLHLVPDCVLQPAEVMRYQRLVWSSVNSASRLQARLHGFLYQHIYKTFWTIKLLNKIWKLNCLTVCTRCKTYLLCAAVHVRCKRRTRKNVNLNLSLWRHFWLARNSHYQKQCVTDENLLWNTNKKSGLPFQNPSFKTSPSLVII